MTQMPPPRAKSIIDDPCATALAECPELAELLDALAQMERLAGKAVRLVGHLQDTGAVEAATGLPLDLWLAARGRCTGSDRRMLATAADVLARLPNVADAFHAGQLSWAQTRAIVLICARLPRHVCQHIDLDLARQLLSLEDADPDEAVRLVRQAAASYDGRSTGPDQRPATTPDDRFVHVQPRLDGTGGRIFGDLDALGLAVFERATDPGPPGRGDRGTSAHRRANRLIDTLAASLADQPGDEDGPGRPRGGDGALLPVAPTLLLTTTLDSLLGRDRTPADLIAGLAGGRLKVPSDLARQLVDEGGAAVRLLVLDDTGRVLGIGRRNHQPPGWLSDATLVIDRVCAQPGCGRPAVHCDDDHLRAWTDGGCTDLPNLQRLCRHHNRTTRKAGWTVTSHADGTRTWSHHRSGVTVRSIPSTRRLTPPRGDPDDDDPG